MMQEAQQEARSTTLSAHPLVETAGDLAARTHCRCHVAMMILRTYKCNSLDCFNSNTVYVFNDVYDVIQRYVY